MTQYFESKIFNPEQKVLVNADRVIELFKTGNTAPVLVEFDPSNACNHGCSFCISNYIHQAEAKGTATFNRSIMSREMLFAAVEDMADMGVRAINWTGGGEPFVNPHLTEVIEWVGKNTDIKMGMFTNGTLVPVRDAYETLVKYMTWVRYSVDAGNYLIYNRVRKPPTGQDWDHMMYSLQNLVAIRDMHKSNMTIGVGFVITPDTYKGIVSFAKSFVHTGVDYCQYKPEIVNREREDGIQREIDFWEKDVEPLVAEAKEILGDKFQLPGYKFSDLKNDPELFGRRYKSCLGSQISPCVGADGHVYVCPNHRGYKEYSYGSLHDRPFSEIWNDLKARRKVMDQIDEVEKFSNCTELCKPHESNKAVWKLFEQYRELVQIENVHGSGAVDTWESQLLEAAEIAKSNTQHHEFV